MKVDDSLLEDTVLNIYARSVYGRYDQRLAAGATLNLGSLREEWRDYHLRAEDLDRALQLLLARGDLRLETVDGEACYSLTESGIGRGTVERQRSPGSVWQFLKSLVKLSSTQQRRTQGGGGPMPRRRGTDVGP
ncbi:MAG: hypothetical protein Q8Q73_04175 [Stagnimonas sp.]|nr:hypothetical protein [Stagnimonas sp.]